MRILVTGGSGMLGAAIIKSLKFTDSSHEILAPHRDELDLFKEEEVDSYIKRTVPDLVIHTAAKVGGLRANIDEPVEFLSQNIRVDSNIMTSAYRHKIRNFLYIGSSCMYPTHTSQPMSEHQILTGELESTNEGYALAKIVGAKAVQLIATKANLAWRTFIFSNLYGPGDHYNSENSHLIAAIITKVLDAKANDLASVEMWGSGNVRREFTYVEDVANYISNKVAFLDTLPVTMNVGYGEDYSVRECYELVCELSEYEGNVVSNPDQPEGMRQKLMNSSLALSHEWSPKTSLRAGIGFAIKEYERRHARNG